MDDSTADNANIGNRVRSAVFWRSGSQIVSQIVTWAATLLVIRILTPADYGLFAMTSVVLTASYLLNGYGFASSLIQSESIDEKRISQAFGMLLLMNGGLALLQILIAPLVASYYDQPMVADMLRVQALIYLSTPFTALPDVLLSRRLDFRGSAKANFAGAVAGACTALGCALAGWGVWTLVFAPIAAYYARAIVLNLIVRRLFRPSFDFRGSGNMFAYGSAVMLTQLFFVIQSQADVAIGGRFLSAHDLGVYFNALFLTQVFATRFVPPLNDVAFPAFSKLQNDPEAFSWSFSKAIRIVMLAAMPIYVGMAATAEPLILAVLSDKWAEMVPLIRLFCIAMPFVTLQIMFMPAANGIGRPDLAVRISAAGAAIMVVTFLIGAQYGVIGLTLAWVIGFPLFTIIAALIILPVIGVTLGQLAKAVAPGLFCALAMGAVVTGVDYALPPLEPIARLAILVPVGGASYAALLFLFARATLDELIRLVWKRGGAKTEVEAEAEA